MEFADELIQFRVKHDVSQVELAKMLGICQEQISKYENGRTQPTRKNLLKYQQIMNDYERK